MPYTAKHRFARIAPKKARLVARLVQGMSVPEALSVLRYSPRRAAPMISKVIESAVANAGYEVEGDELFVQECVVNDGPRMKRWRPVMRGMAHPILKRSCHISVALERIEEQ